MSKNWKLIFILSLLLTVTLWLAVLAYPTQNMQIIACDVGQGDAILVTLGSRQMLIDGGPNNKVVDCLSKYMPFWDREVEMVILTHPQADHYTGLIDVFSRYKVDLFLANALDASSQEYRVLKEQVGGSDARVINPTTGTVIRLGLIHLDILNPSKEFIAQNSSVENSVSQSTSDKNAGVLGAYTSKLDPNEFSVVVLLNYKDTSALFTGDIAPDKSDLVAQELENMQITVDYLKVPHHGSKNGMTKKLLDAASPSVAAISVGKNNRYGHPNAEIVQMLNNKQVKIFRTDELGDVIVNSDGTKLWYNKN
jgi:competence protein ComEC